MAGSTASRKQTKTVKGAAKSKKGATEEPTNQATGSPQKSKSIPHHLGTHGNKDTESSLDVELEELEYELSSTELTCDVCFDSKDASLFHQGKLAPTCKHSSSFCAECVGIGIRAQLSDKQWETIECIICKVVLPSNTLRQYLDIVNFQRYNDYISNFHISKAKLYTQCQQPTCGAGQIHYGGGKNPQMICNKCGHVTCYSCKVPYHHGRSCKLYQKTKLAAALQAKINALPEDQKSQMMVTATTNLCPGCKAPVERWTGCRNMMCTCGAYFYWQDPKKSPEMLKQLELGTSGRKIGS